MASPQAIDRDTAALAILRMVENQMAAFSKLSSSIDTDAAQTILRIVENQSTTINSIPPPIDNNAALAILHIFETQTTVVTELTPLVNSDSALAILRIFENQKAAVNKLPSSSGDAALSILRILEKQMAAVDQVAPVLFGENSTRALKRKLSLNQQESEVNRTRKRMRGEEGASVVCFYSSSHSLSLTYIPRH